MLATTSRLALALQTRALELHSVINSTHATDRAGRLLPPESAMSVMEELLVNLRSRNGCAYLVGNGGSAAVAAHSATDFLKVGRLRALTLHDAPLLTCMSNDYAYEDAFARALTVLCQPADVLVAISSSGRSASICNAVAAARGLGATVVTLSGFAPTNPLRALGDVNVWLDSSDYGMVEIGHQFVLHNLIDRLGLERQAANAAASQ